MKNKVLAVTAVAVLATLLSAAVVAVSSPRASTRPPGDVDVVMMRCATGSEFGVKSYEGSTAAPRKRSGTCPENLARLLKDGFSIESVGYFDQDEKFIAYTLIR